MEIDVTRLIETVDPSELSASVAERGKHAGQETWANSLAEAERAPVLADDEREEARAFFKGFGAWDDDEIAAWTPADLDALVLQYAAGDLREVQDLCPGDGLGEIDWDDAEELSQEGTIGGRLFASGDRLMIYIGD